MVRQRDGGRACARVLFCQPAGTLPWRTAFAVGTDDGTGWFFAWVARAVGAVRFSLLPSVLWRVGVGNNLISVLLERVTNTYYRAVTRRLRDVAWFLPGGLAFRGV